MLERARVLTRKKIEAIPHCKENKYLSVCPDTQDGGKSVYRDDEGMCCIARGWRCNAEDVCYIVGDS